jgi:hypothetical protein
VTGEFLNSIGTSVLFTAVRGSSAVTKIMTDRECPRVIVGVIYKENYSYNIFYECLLAIVQACDKISSYEKTMQNPL